MITSKREQPDDFRDARPKTQPIEVWLSQPNLQVSCRAVYEDERTATLDVDALSMRGAQREVTGFLIERGYTPAGRWEIERLLEGDREGVAAETSRRFKPGSSVRNLLEPEPESNRPIGKPTEGDAGEFFIYENWTNTFALIHRGSCSFCNHGRGVQGRGSKTRNGQWHGPVVTLDEAISAARDAASRHSNWSVWTVRPCGSCLRSELRGLQ